MKLLIKIAKILVSTALTVYLLTLIFTGSYHYSWSALDAFHGGNSLTQFFGFLVKAFFALTIWVVGFFLYFGSQRIKKINALLYFPLLTTVALFSFIYSAVTVEPEWNRSLKMQICAKAQDDGMELTFDDLTKEEYDFINSKRKWLPEIPVESKTIRIHYFRDDFLGDFDLNIWLTLNSDTPLDTLKYPDWGYDGTYYYYNAFQQ